LLAAGRSAGALSSLIQALRSPLAHLPEPVPYSAGLLRRRQPTAGQPSPPELGPCPDPRSAARTATASGGRRVSRSGTPRGLMSSQDALAVPAALTPRVDERRVDDERAEELREEALADVREGVLRPAVAARRSAAGISSVATALASCGSSLSRNAAMRGGGSPARAFRCPCRRRPAQAFRSRRSCRSPRTRSPARSWRS
jgi:hypothetical protein